MSGRDCPGAGAGGPARLRSGPGCSWRQCPEPLGSVCGAPAPTSTSTSTAERSATCRAWRAARLGPAEARRRRRRTGAARRQLAAPRAAGLRGSGHRGGSRMWGGARPPAPPPPPPPAGGRRGGRGELGFFCAAGRPLPVRRRWGPCGYLCPSVFCLGRGERAWGRVRGPPPAELASPQPQPRV